jgi:adenylate cyclase
MGARVAVASKRIDRKLAAIVAADVAGYSRLMAADEEGTLARLKGHRAALIDPKIAEHGGRIIKTTGDGMLVEFASVVDALRCLVEIQRGMLERNADIPAEKRIDFRVGINVGDVIVDCDDIYGDGVNVAARLESLAEPGGILVAGVVRDQVRDKLSFSFDDLGDQSVKNIPRSVRAYRVRLNDDGPPPLPKRAARVGMGGRRIAAIVAAALLLTVVAGGGAWYSAGGLKSAATVAQQSIALPTLPEPGKPLPHLSIVVLPFANLSGDATQDYFADGVTESLTTDLSRISGSFVIARNTAFTFKGKNVDAKEIGKQLGVRYVLEGSVQRGSTHVRVNAQLIDSESGGHLWADRFDKPLGDLFVLQDEIVAALASQLNAELISDEARRAEHAPKADSMDLYFQGMARLNQGFNPEDLAQARGFFERANRGGREGGAAPLSSRPRRVLVADVYRQQQGLAWGLRGSRPLVPTVPRTQSNLVDAAPLFRSCLGVAGAARRSAGRSSNRACVHPEIYHPHLGHGRGAKRQSGIPAAMGAAAASHA